MVQYYWNPTTQPPSFFPQGNQQTSPPQVMVPGGPPSALPAGERSFIENILRLNIGKPGTFYFSFSNVVGEQSNTRQIIGSVKAAGRDHVIITEASTGHDFLFPMIYFDYAEFDEPVEYFPQTIGTREI